MKKGIRWDEPNLQYNFENKSSTMKIDEPKTPFNHGYNLSADLDDDFSLGGNSNAGSKGNNTETEEEDSTNHDDIDKEREGKLRNIKLSEVQQFQQSRKEHYGNMKGLLQSKPDESST